METIRTAHHLAIELDATTWRLVDGLQISDDRATPVALLEVRPDGITCSPAFARARHLSEPHLDPADVARVVVGWAPETHDWHIGLLLNTPAEGEHRLRWCGLASWPDGLADEHAAEARRAGEALARILDRPFHLIPPPVAQTFEAADTQPVQITQRTAVAPALRRVAEEPLQAPPFVFEDCALVAVAKGYVWRQRARWVLQTALRAVGFLALVVLFVVLGVGSLTSGLASVNPQWLPWLGLGVGAVMLVIGLRQFWKLLTVADVVIDTAGREVRHQGRLFGRVRWRLPFEAVQYVLLSQTPARAQGHADSDGAVRVAQDAWLHLYDGRRFRLVAALGRVEGTASNWEAVRAAHKKPGRRRLSLSDIRTPAHHAARLMAETLGADVWLDIR